MQPWTLVQLRGTTDTPSGSKDLHAAVLAQARRVQVQGRPAILTLKHLAELVNVPYVDLRRVIARRDKQPYRCFSMRKRRGGFRLICIPRAQLKQAQTWIAKAVLNRTCPPDSFFAYAPGSSAIAVAERHCCATWLIKIDIQQFFESVSERQVYWAFCELGYEPLISFELARLCTRVHVNKNRRYRNRRWTAAHSTSITEYAAPRGKIGHLPQGAPTSPMLSNLVLKSLDRELEKVSRSRGLVYTRYADDLIFSTAEATFTRQSAIELVRACNAAMVRFGFRPRTDKTVISPPGARKLVLGLVVDGEKPRLTRQYRNQLEAEIYGIEQFGIIAHTQSRGWSSTVALMAHLDGKLRYANQVQPEFARKLATRLAKAMSDAGEGRADQLVAPDVR